MQFSGNWLKELLDINISTEELCNQMTMLGIEVDNFTTYMSKITGEDAEDTFLKLVKDITSKGFVRSNYKDKLVDLSNVRINLKSNK